MAAWIDVGGHDAQQVQQALRPYPAEEMEAIPVSTRVNSVDNDDPRLVDPAETADFEKGLFDGVGGGCPPAAGPSSRRGPCRWPPPCWLFRMSKSKGKVGSDPAATRQVVGQEDFGVAADEHSPERQYVSEGAKLLDPGKAPERSGTGERTSGVGGSNAGLGSSSGGDVETGPQALVGIGDPNQHPPHGSLEEMQPPVDPKDRQPLEKPIIDPDPTRGGHRDSPSSDSAADVNNETRSDDDAFRGDVTADEAGGS